MNRVISNIVKIVCGGVIAGIFCLVLIPTATYADGKATVIVDSAIIRSSASVSSAAVGGAVKNTSMDILSTETTDGYTWYKVTAPDGTVGYVRGDLVTTEGVSTSSTDTATTATAEPVTATPVEVSADYTEVEPVEAKVAFDARIRSGASTSDSIVTNVKAGTSVTVAGYKSASDGAIWYRVNDGYILGELVTLSGELVEKLPEPEPEPEPEPAPEPEPEPVEVYTDYELVHDDAENAWYIYDYTTQKRAKAADLFAAAENTAAKEAEYKATIKKKNVAVVILSIIVVLLIGAGAYAYISIRKWYFGDDSDTEEPVIKKAEPRTSSQPTKTPSSGFKMPGPIGETPASKPASKPATSAKLEGVRLPDGRIQMPDGSIRRVVVKLADGSLKYPDGTIKRPDGTIVKSTDDAFSTNPGPAVRTGASSHTVREVPLAHTSEGSDDDMEYGFLGMDK